MLSVPSVPLALRLPGAWTLVLLGLCVTCLWAPPADAAHDVAVTVSTPAAEAARMRELVDQRADALGALDRRADERERMLLGRRAVLAEYGYSGDPDEVTIVLPLASYRVSAGFGLTGPLWEAEHGGQDFGATSGETLVAVGAATVTEVSYAGPYGLRTILTLADGTEVWYCHQTSVSVTTGQQVEVAEPIGLVGSTGNSVGPHLHLEVRVDGSPVDPMEWLRQWGLEP